MALKREQIVAAQKKADEVEETDQLVPDEKLKNLPSTEVASAVTSTVDGSVKEVKKMIAETETKIKLIGEFIKRQLKDGVDYGSIAFHARTCPMRGNPQMGPNCKTPFCKMSKPFLHKPGSEKFAILFNHRAKFYWLKQDFDKGQFVAKCVLIARKNDKIMGEGYGAARTSEKERWTDNEAIKICCKRALVDAALRVYGLSEHFTQDLDDIAQRPDTPPQAPERPVARVSPPSSPYPKRQENAPMTISDLSSPITTPQRNKIFLLIDRLGQSKEWFEKWQFDQIGIEGIENLTKGIASRFIDIMQKKYDTQAMERTPIIDVSEPKENIKSDMDIMPDAPVEAPDEWNDL